MENKAEKNGGQSPKVSVIVPVYKAEKYLRKCVDSILAQTFRDFEIILVDDGSPDGSGAICDEYAAEYDCVRVKHISNGGAAVARNRGIDMAKGEFIMFVDSDDTIEPNMLEELVSLQKRYKVDIAASRLEMRPKYNRYPLSLCYSKLECLRLLLLGELDCSPCTKIYRRSIVKNVRFPEGVTNEDIIFLYRIYSKVNSVCVINKSFYNYRRNVNSVTHTLGKSVIDIVNNANWVYNDVVANFPQLRGVAKTYKCSLYIQFCYLLLKFKVVSLYRNEYKLCRAECIKRMLPILVSTHYFWKYKLEFVFILLIPSCVIRSKKE